MHQTSNNRYNPNGYGGWRVTPIACGPALSSIYLIPIVGYPRPTLITCYVILHVNQLWVSENANFERFQKLKLMISHIRRTHVNDCLSTHMSSYETVDGLDQLRDSHEPNVK